MSVEVRQMTADDVDVMQHGFSQMGWSKPDGYFANCLQQQKQGDIVMLIGHDGTQYAGHVKVKWQSEYGPFRDEQIPEIQDLNVIPKYRRKKVASRLVDRAELIIKTRSKIVGIGVGLHPGYNAAQRLYVALGYVPDGRGVVFQNRFVVIGETVKMDDSLILHLTKNLAATTRSGVKPSPSSELV